MDVSTLSDAIFMHKVLKGALGAAESPQLLFTLGRIAIVVLPTPQLYSFLTSQRFTIFQCPELGEKAHFCAHFKIIWIGVHCGTQVSPLYTYEHALCTAFFYKT